MVAVTDPDWTIRLAAFNALATLTRERGPVLPWSTIEKGFRVSSHTFLFANQSKGIFRPAGMTGAALSVKTTVPRRGPRKYDDIARGGSFTYALQSRGAEYHDNKLLLLAAKLGTPLIYFFGVEPGYYRPIWPAFVASVNKDDANVTLVVGDAGEFFAPGEHVADGVMRDLVRRYATVEVKRRLHQDVFRHLVIGAYEERCAICRLPRRELLDASHIVPDRDVRGEPRVTNGLALCKLHHAAYDTSLVGIRPDYVIEVSDALLRAVDGPTLEHGIKGFAGKQIHLPRRAQDRPSAEHLEERYASFRRTGT